MAAPTLLLSALLALGTSVGFAAVAVLLLRRGTPESGQSARIMFCLFWASACVVWAAQGLQAFAAFLGAAGFGLVSALDQVTTPFYCLAAASLLYYALYLFTGRERLLLPILAYYLVLFFLLRWRVEDAHRLGIAVGSWVVGFQYEHPLQGSAYTAIVALVALPVLAAVLAYGSLFFRVDEPGLRYRVALTALGLFTWISTEAFSYTSGFANTAPGELTRRIVALASGFIVLLAYRPPRFARRRWAATDRPTDRP